MFKIVGVDKVCARQEVLTCHSSKTTGETNFTNDASVASLNKSVPVRDAREPACTAPATWNEYS